MTATNDAMDGLYGMPGHLVRRLQQISTALFTEECAHADMTSVQFAALTAIHAHAGLDATRLSALIAFDRSTLGSVLERLEAKRWIARVARPGDKRVKLLRLTPAGAAALEAVGPSVGRVQQRLLAPLEPDDRTLLVALLTRLAELHGEAAPAVLRAAG